jgi:SNF2 family DNA or RNA helicase
MIKKFEKQNSIKIHKYQKTGINWCVDKERNGVELEKDKDKIYGGLICDEMGLGKTFQIILTILSTYLPKTLIVLPRILLEQWEEIFIKYLNHKPLIYHGKCKSKLAIEDLKTAPIILTTYHMLLKQKNQINNIQEIEWDRIIFDEAHHLRNKKTKLYIAAVSLKSKIKWLITGTPIQNHMQDIYSLFDILKINKSYYKCETNFSIIVEKLILKRTKEEVGLNLPSLNEHTIYVDWKDEKEKTQAIECHNKLSFSGLEIKDTLTNFEILKYFIKCKQSCIDLSLICDNSNHTKLDRVIETIKERKTSKKLIFCHFKKEIKYLHTKLLSEKFKVEYFDGSVSMKTRKLILENEPDILILQIQTGCEGLNLQQFNDVYFVSLSWNPAIESQAIARCHRIGQTSEINVFRFKMSSFDDEYITKSLDIYIDICQLKKRTIMNILSNDKTMTQHNCPISRLLN